jgi:ribonuclease VapC
VSSRRFVLDASALLCALVGEKGSESVQEALADACISAVNVAEVIAKLTERGVPFDEIMNIIRELNLDIVLFTVEHAVKSGAMRLTTKRFGLSLGDRACLALAQAEQAIALTADRIWADIDVGVEVRLVR